MHRSKAGSPMGSPRPPSNREPRILMSRIKKYSNFLQVAGIPSWGRWEDHPRKLPKPVRESIEEFRSGAVMPDRDVPVYYGLPLSTASGPRSFRYAQEVDRGDPQSEPTPVDWNPRDYADFEKVVAISRLLIAVPNPEEPGSQDVRHALDKWLEAERDDPESRCGAIIESLQRPNLEHDERRRLILESEVLPFRGQQAAALAPLLRQFVERYRESNVPADQIAVGSAIRNYVATATIDDAFEAAASLLKAHSRNSISIDLEVEVTKMVVRKLTANPPADREQYSELARRLEELVDDYARPRLLSREKYGAVALNAVLGLVLTRSGRDTHVVETMRTLQVAWFQQLVGRRAGRLRADLVTRRPGAEFADTIHVLEQLTKLDPSALAS